MAVIAVSMVKDEADIIATTVAHMAAQVDEVIVADNGSTDGTVDILHELGVTVVHDPDPAYRQSEKITALAHSSKAGPSDWIVPFDADEMHCSPHGTLRHILTELVGVDIATADLFDHVATALDADDADPVRRMQWRRNQPAPLPKIAARCRPDLVIEQGNHGAHFTDTTSTTIIQPAWQIRHFSARSVDQFVHKIRNGADAYAASDLPEHFGAHWREWGRILDDSGEAAIADLFREWYWSADPAGDGLVHDPCPMS
jgi:hypothetical protein